MKDILGSIVEKTLVTYAQNREDLLLHVLLYEVKKGFYVDVGANDPELKSVTKFFYDRGWRGINIEPIPRLYRELQKSRKRDINLNIGVAPKPGKLNLREYNGEKHGWSTFSQDIKDLHDSEKDYTEYEVNIKPLATILKECKCPEIDFLKVDVEGYEYEVLSSNNWKKYRPKVIVVENTYPEKWRRLLEQNGYVIAYDDILNLYFVRADLEKSLNMHRNYGQALLSGQQIITSQHAELLKQQKILVQENQILNERWKIINERPYAFLGVRNLSNALIIRIGKKLIGRKQK